MISKDFRGACALLFFIGTACSDPSLVDSDPAPPGPPACTETGVARFNEVLRICGLITSETVNLFNSQELSKVTHVIINSGGGNSGAAIELGRQIQSHGFSLIVDNWCLSACAQFILPATSHVVLRPNALVGFHHTAYALHLALLQLEGYEEPIASAASRVEVQYYESLGIDPDFLLLPLRNLKVAALVLIEPPSDKDETEIYYEGPSFLLVEGDMLERVLGIDVVGTGRVGDIESGTVIEISSHDTGLFLTAEDLDFQSDASRSIKTLCLKRNGSAQMQCKDYP